jgi:hypothetical protein
MEKKKKGGVTLVDSSLVTWLFSWVRNSFRGPTVLLVCLVAAVVSTILRFVWPIGFRGW